MLKKKLPIGIENFEDIIKEDPTLINNTDETTLNLYNTYVSEAQKKQSNIGVYNPTVWCCRQNQWGTALAQAVKKYGYKMARGYVRGDYLNLQFDKKFPVLDSKDFHTGDNADINSLIDSAEGKEAIIVLLSHRVVDSLSDDRGYDVLASDYESVLSHIKELSDNG